MRSYRKRWAFRVLGEKLNRLIIAHPLIFLAWVFSYIPIRLAIEWIRPGG